MFMFMQFKCIIFYIFTMDTRVLSLPGGRYRPIPNGFKNYSVWRLGFRGLELQGVACGFQGSQGRLEFFSALLPYMGDVHR